MHTNTQSKTKINGLLSDLFTFGRGVPQGCSPSIILQVTAAEVLAISIDPDTMIKWVEIGDHETKHEISLMISSFFFKDIAYLTRMQLVLE